MPTGPRLLIDNACYHIITRGNQQQEVFLRPQDYETYISVLRKLKRKYNFLLYGYCLMPNHVHLVGEPTITKDLSRFMQSLNRTYTAYFNKNYQKVGHLWQGRFISKVITKDKYLLDCIEYIELNPVRANLVRTAGDYAWSSYKERILSGETKDKLINNLEL